MFVMMSDGESWSGEVEKSLQNAIDAGIPVFVVGVGTLAGGRMPEWVPKTPDEEADPETPLISRLDREGLQRIASVGGGQYFELDRDGDRHIANAIIDAGKRLAPAHRRDRSRPRSCTGVFSSSAPCFAVIGLLFLRERSELWIQLMGGVAVLLALSTIIG